MRTEKILAAVAVLAIAALALLAVPSDADSSGSDEWSDRTYWITFDGGVGSSSKYGESASFAIKGGSNSIEFPVTTWTKEGYYLTGWNDSDGTTHSLSERFTPTRTETLTAVWAKEDGDHLTDGDATLAEGEKYERTICLKNAYWGPLQVEYMYIQGPDGISCSEIYTTGIWDRNYVFTGSLYEPGIYVVSMCNSTLDHGRNWWLLAVPSEFDSEGTVGFYETMPDENDEPSIAITAPIGTSITLPSSGFTKTGCVLAYWYIGVEGGNFGNFALGSSFTVTKNKMIAIPQWVETANVVVYVANGAELTVDGSVTYGDTAFQLESSSDVVPMDGDTLIGWELLNSNVVSDTSGVLYAPGLSMTATGSLFFSACFAKTSELDQLCKITYDAGNGGMTSVTSQYVPSGKSVYLPTESEASLAGYNLTGWSVDGELIQSDTYTPSGDVTLTAVWEAQTKKPTGVYINGGATLRVNGTLDLYAYTKGDRDAIRGVHFEITEGGEYASIEEQKETSYGGMCTLSGLKAGGMVIVKAICTAANDLTDTYTVKVLEQPNRFAISYAAPDAETCPDDTTTSSDSKAVTLRVTYDEPSRPGWTFDSWNTYSDGSGDRYVAGDSVSLTTEKPTLPLYAVWTENDHTYVLTYDLGTDADGNPAPGSLDAAYIGSKDDPYGFTVTSKTPGWVGYKFLGWSDIEIEAGLGTEADVKYRAGDTFSVSRDGTKTVTYATLYAVWADDRNTFTLILDPNGGTMDDDKKETVVTLTASVYSFPIPLDSDPVRDDGGKFVGWTLRGSSALESGEKVYYAGNRIPMTAVDNRCTVTLKAVWSNGADSHCFTFVADADGDEVEGMPSAVSAESIGGMSDLTVPSDVPLRVTDGDRFYVFAGWAMESGEILYPGESRSVGEDYVLKATWAPFSLTVSGTRATLVNEGAAVGTEVYVDMLGDGDFSVQMRGKQTEVSFGYPGKGTYGTVVMVVLPSGFQTSVVRSVVIESGDALFEVTYHSNDGKDLTETRSGTEIEIAGCPFDAPEGLAFGSWNTMPDGSGERYDAGTAKTLTTDLHLYAQWTDGTGDDGDGMPLLAIVAVVLILISGYVVFTRVI